MPPAHDNFEPVPSQAFHGFRYEIVICCELSILSSGANSGYAQAVRQGDTVWIAGQLGHNEDGQLLSGMEPQMIQSYANIKYLLAQFNLTMENIVEEVIYTTDMPAAFEARKNNKTKFYANPKSVASTIVGVTDLAIQGQLVEIKVVART